MSSSFDNSPGDCSASSCDNCPICCQESVTWLIGCPGCPFTACHHCWQTYIIGTLAEPKCMSCKKPWSNEYVMETFSSTAQLSTSTSRWVNKEYLPHMAHLLLEQEKMLLPETQPLANNALQVKELQQQVAILPLNKKLEKLYKKYPSVLAEKIRERNRTKGLLQDQIKELRGVAEDTPKKSPTTQTKYVMKCPYDGCRGYVTEAFVCETCEQHTCQHCRTQSHTGKCDEGALLNMREILSTTRTCPKCYVHIFKAGGCDQMWCSNCHVTFSFNTGKIDEGPIHNPVYYEYLASRPTELNMTPLQLENIACGDVPTVELYSGHVRYYHPRFSYQYFKVYRQKLHIENVVLPHYSLDRVKDNVDLRVRYLTGEITEEQWHNSLLLRQKKRMKFNAITQLFQTILVILNDTIRRIYASTTQDDTLWNDAHHTSFTSQNIKRIIRIHGGSIPDNIISLNF